MVRIASLGLVLLAGLVLAGRATFCDDEGPDPYAPPAPHEHRDESGRRCVDANILDVMYALNEADRAR